MRGLWDIYFDGVSATTRMRTMMAKREKRIFLIMVFGMLSGGRERRA
jgi:ribosomal protein L13